MAAVGGQMQPQGQGAPCPKCQASNPPGAKFCVACGNGLQAVAGLSCPSCSVTSPANAAFCIGCGTALKPKCSKCSAQLPAGAKFCLDCGTPVAKA
jgi:ribosomal protein L40E